MNRQKEKMRALFGLPDIQDINSPLDFTGKHTHEHENRFVTTEGENEKNPSVMPKYNNII